MSTAKIGNRWIKKNCESCGNEFETEAKVLNRGWGRFCSLSCAAKRKRERKVRTSKVIGIVPLTNGMVAIVDPEDYDEVSRYNWYASAGGSENTFYAYRRKYIEGKRHIVSMHREIMGLDLGDERIVDHKDRDGLNNRRYNLRMADHSVNSHNRKLTKSNTSGYRGVFWNKKTERWMAACYKNHNVIHCGSYSDIILAAKARDEMAIKLYGDAAVLNFKGEGHHV